MKAALRHLSGLVAVSAVLGVVAAGLAMPLVGVLGVGARQTADGLTELPRALALGRLPERTTLLDADGRRLATLYDQNRVSVPLGDVSRRMVEALLAIEDYRFHQHGALDLRGTLRALAANAGSGGVVQGGSTLTQQLVKQSLVLAARTDDERAAATERTYARKLTELRHAVALEQQLTKDEILERYLNTVYLGSGTYGVQAAARHYFDVDAADLDLRQGALLAGLVQSPAALDPTRNPERARERRDVVLDRMAELGAITERRADRAQARDLGLDVTPTRSGCVAATAPFACAYVLRWLEDDPALGDTRAERRRFLRTGGLTIRTTVEPEHQAAADASVTARVDPTDEAVGALAMIEPGTGAVTALAQSRPMGADVGAGETFLNHTVPAAYGDAAGFQAGSTFKTFVLAAAIEQGVPLDTRLPSPDVGSYDAAAFENCPGSPPFSGGFTVGNLAVTSTSGSEDLYTGTQRSINTFYLRLTQETGVCAPYRLAQRAGVDLSAPDGGDGSLPERVPVFALGVADASPLEMAEAYATFAARGRHCDARPVAALTDGAGSVLRRYDPVCEQVVAPTTADAVNDVLRGVLEGGFAAAQALDVPAAGKTGNNEGLSVWFAGHTPHLAAAAVVAGADASGSPASLDGRVVGGVTVSGASGSTLAAPLWGDAMRAVDHTLPATDFTAPAGVAGAR